MKVLFAVNNDKIAESIIRKYQEEYREIISSKTVYYFNAIIKELQKDKSYDRIVISEDLEMFANDNYQAIDKFIFEKMDAISDEATNSEGNDIPIILLCTDRRTKNDPILVKLFGLGIYGVLIGQDRSIPKVCNLIYKPRSKKEAKQYYKVESENVNYSAEQDGASVSETEIQNIVYHYKKIGNNVAKCVQSFDSIYNQYSEEQIKLIVQVLPTSSKIILEENSEKYREVMGIKGNSNKSYNNNQEKEYVETKINSGNKLTKPVIIPTSVNVQKVNKVKNSNQELQEKQERLKAESKRLEEAKKARALEKKKEEARIAREKAKAEAEAKKKEEDRIAKEKAKAEAEAKKKEEARIAREKAKAEAEAKKKEEARIAREKAKAEAEAKKKEVDKMAKEKGKAVSTAKKNVGEKVTKNKTGATTKAQKNGKTEVVEEPKRGRGRPRKNPEVVAAAAAATAVITGEVAKRKRGRPRKEETNTAVKEVEKIVKPVSKPKKDTKKEEVLDLEEEKENLKNNKIIENIDDFEDFDDFDEFDNFDEFEDEELETIENEFENDEDFENDIDDDFEDNDDIDLFEEDDDSDIFDDEDEDNEIESELDDDDDDLDLFDDEEEDEDNTDIEIDSKDDEDFDEDDDLDLFDDEDSEGSETETDSNEEDDDFDFDDEDDDLDLFDDEDDEDIETETDSNEEDDDFDFDDEDDLDLFDDEDDEDIETETNSNEDVDDSFDEDDDLDLFDDEDDEDIETETNSNEDADDSFDEDDDLDLFDDEDDEDDEGVETETNSNEDTDDSFDEDDDLNLFDDNDSEESTEPTTDTETNNEEDEDLFDLFDDEDETSESSNSIIDEEDDFEKLISDDEEDDEINLPTFEDDEDISDNSNDEQIIVPSPNGNFDGINNKNYKYDSNLADSIKDLEEAPNSDENNSYNADIDNLITSGQKVVAFVGTPKNGTSFLVNNLADVFASKGIKTAILDLTKNKNAFYTYTNNEEALRVKAYECLEKLRSGTADGIKVNENLSIYTCLPGEDDSLDDATGIIQTLINNYSIVLLDCDFSTNEKYFRVAQEIYLVQSLDVLTIQPLTAFLREQKVKGILNPKKLRIVINKNIKVSTITEKLLIEGMSSYNDPGMTYMTELFDKNTIKYTTVPFDSEVYIKYLEGLVNCKISTKKYPKNFLVSLNKLCDMVYPNVSASKDKKFNEYDKKTKKFENAFSKNTNSTLDKMKKNIK